MNRLQLLTAGESHGPGLTAILSGIPAGLTLDPEVIRLEMRRRQHGFGRGRRMQIEVDEVEIRSGVRGGEALGSPIALWIENRDFANWRPMMDPWTVDPKRSEQRRIRSPRPGHADLSGSIKFLYRDPRNALERASARESAARVAAGAIVKTLLNEFDIEIRSGVRSLGPIGVDAPTPDWEALAEVDDESPLRAIDRDLEESMIAEVERAKSVGDTLGGSVTVIARNVPPGLGSHVQWNEKLDGRLSRAVMSVPAVKAVEIGSALAASRGPGSRAHDPIEYRKGSGWERPTNRAGGLEGGVTNGADVVITAYKKPISTLRQGIPSVDLDTLEAGRSQYERSDVTALPAAGVVAEAMVALVIADALLVKLGGDSMTELLDHWEASRRLQADWPGAGVSE